MTKTRLLNTLLDSTKVPATPFKRPTGVTGTTKMDKLYGYIQENFGCNKKQVTKLVEMILKIKFPYQRYFIPKAWSVHPLHPNQAIVPWKKVPRPGSQEDWDFYRVGKVFVYFPDTECAVGPLGYCMHKLDDDSLKYFRVATRKEIRAFVNGLTAVAVKRFSE